MIFRRLKVSDLARHSDVTATAIRHYTGEGLLSPTRNPSNGYQYYQYKDIERVRFILQAKKLGFRISEIGKILAHADKGRSPCPDVRDIVKERAEENRRKLIELELLQSRMEDAIHQWNVMPNKAPSRDSICHLIESVTEIMNKT